jgi:alanyl-tRNA synthetase
VVGQDALLTIDSPRRDMIRTSHTGTHVLHQSLRDVLGEHAHQAGSLVEDGRLRFDFSHFQATTRDELDEVEIITNRRLIANGAVSTTVTSHDEARRMGALAFFGDKYGDTVRVVKVGDYSTEFCGGTHTATAAAVGPLVVLSEQSIGSNIRRIEALTGEPGYRYLAGVRSSLDDAGRMLRVPPGEVPGRIDALIAKVEELETELEAIRSRGRSQLSAELAEGAETVGEAAMVVSAVGEMPPDQLRQVAVGVRERLGRCVVVLGATNAGKGALVCAVATALVGAGVSAASILAGGARELGGGGSRDPELSQAGGPRGDNLARALDVCREETGRALAAL